MDQENPVRVDINSADEDALTELQGVGTHLAEQIIEARPFSSIDDLTRVRGISENDVERLHPYLSISEPTEQPQVLEENNSGEDGEDDGIPPSAAVEDLDDTDLSSVDAEGDKQEDQATDEVVNMDDVETTSEGKEIAAAIVAAETISEVDQEPIIEESEAIEQEPAEVSVSQPNYITRGGACGLVLIGAFFTLILAVTLTLGVISSINQGRLNYASPSQVAALESQNEALSSQSQALSEDIDSLRARMDNLESLSGQVSEMEIEISAMQEDIDQLQTEMAANQAAYEELAVELDAIEEELLSLTSQAERFEGFLEGMRTLMESLFPQSPEVEETP